MPLQVYDPLTTQANPAYDSTQPVSTANLQYDRAPFPNSIIPASRLDPVAQKIISYIPPPNTDVGPYFQNNYFVVSPETDTASGMIAKIDHSFDDKRRLSVSIAYTNGFDAAAHYIDNAADPGSPDRQYSNRRITAEHVLTLSPGSVNTATVDISSNVSANSSGSIDPATALGLTGLSAQVFPRINFGFLPVGRYNPNTRMARNVFTFTDAQSLKLGKHSLRLSGQFQRQQVDTYQPSAPAGAFYTSAGYTDLPGIVNTGSQFTSFLLGAVDSGDVSDVLSPSYFRISRYVLIATDTWELAPGLTLSFGLTFELQSPRIEKYNRQSTVDLNAINPADGLPGALIFAGLNGAPTGFQPYHRPRRPLRLGGLESRRQPQERPPRQLCPQLPGAPALRHPVGHPGFQWRADLYRAQFGTHTRLFPGWRRAVRRPAPRSARRRRQRHQRGSLRKLRARPPSTSPPASPMNARCPSRSSSRSAFHRLGP